MKKSILFLFLFSSLLFSCQKETPNLTQGQLTALRMENDFGIGPNGVATFSSILVVNQYNNNTIYTSSTNAKITSDGFIIIFGVNNNTVTYNLEQLKSYFIQTQNLYLYF